MRLKRLFVIPKKRLLKKLLGFDEIYTIGIRKHIQGNELVYDGEREFKVISYSSKYWYADPIIFSYMGKDYLFVEAFDRDINQGAIAVAELYGTLDNVLPEIIIKENYHMSFPMTFEWNEAIYMLPETSENNSINLYKSNNPKCGWSNEAVFYINKQIVDTIVIKKEINKLTLLASEINIDNPLMTRYQIYYIDNDNGQYNLRENKAFNENQQFSLKSRNAGGLCNIDNREFHVSQESTKIDYGVWINFGEMTLYEHDYEEHCFKQIGSDDINVKEIDKDKIIGIHTYSLSDKYEIIDMRYLRFSPKRNWKKLKHIIKG
jgi:hypothetical protein